MSKRQRCTDVEQLHERVNHLQEIQQHMEWKRKVMLRRVQREGLTVDKWVQILFELAMAEQKAMRCYREQFNVQ